MRFVQNSDREIGDWVLDEKEFHSMPLQLAPLTYVTARRVASLRLSAEVLISLIQGLVQGESYTAEGIPADAKVAGIGLDNREPNTFTVLLESETFHDVPQGAMPPEIQVFLTRHKS